MPRADRGDGAGYDRGACGDGPKRAGARGGRGLDAAARAAQGAHQRRHTHWRAWRALLAPSARTMRRSAAAPQRRSASGVRHVHS